MRSTSGYDLIDQAAANFLAERLLPLADVITPNMAEAAHLAEIEVTDLESMKRAAQQLHRRCRTQTRSARNAVLVTGGHLAEEAIDVLCEGDELRLFRAEKISTRHTHGTGCTLSSAIAALLARGYDVPEAVRSAKDYVAAALRAAPNIGHGAGPLNHSVKGEE